MSGEFIFELEGFDSDKVTIDNAVYNVSKMLTENDKYMMFVQMLEVPEGDMTQSDMSQLANVLKKAVHNNPRINGVVLLPPNYEITLMSAKLKTSDYELPIELSEEDLKSLEPMKCRTPLRGLRSNYSVCDDFLGDVESILSETNDDTSKENDDLPWD
jgi:hypothetical protein